MANFAYTEFKRALAAGEIDWDTNDFRVLAVMSNTTADTDEDSTSIDGIGTLDECDDTGYVRKALASEAITVGTAADEANCDAADFSGGSAYSFNGDASRNITGVVVYMVKDAGSPEDDTTNMPCFYIDRSASPLVPVGTVTVTWHADGVWKVT